jgi:hypothetical protein
MKNLRNYINERLVLSKNRDNQLSNIKLDSGQFIMRAGDFYRWYFGIDNFDDITEDYIDNIYPWFMQVEDGVFKTQMEVYDFIKKFVDDDNDYVVAEQNDVGNTIEVMFELGDVEFTHDITEEIPDNIIIRKN